MARLPQPGGDNGNWGTILNEYLSETLDTDGKIKDNAVTSNTIAPDSITNIQIADGTIQEAKLASAVQTKLNAGTASPDWSAITNKPAVLASGSDSLTARKSIDAALDFATDVPITISAHAETNPTNDKTTVGTSRVPYIVLADATNIKLVYHNFNYSSATSPPGDVTPTTDVIIGGAALDYGGIITKATFSGVYGVTIKPGGIVTSDPISIDVIAGQTLNVRTYMSGGTWHTARYSPNVASAVGGFTTTTDLTATGSGAIADGANAYMSGPVQILGTTIARSNYTGVARKKSVCVVGDSIVLGFNDGVYQPGFTGWNSADKLGRGGWVDRAAVAQGWLPIKIGMANYQANYAANNSITRRFSYSLISKASNLIFSLGINDINNGRTLAQLQTDLITLWSIQASQGKRVFQLTITPIASSTDIFQTLANQSVLGNEAVRVGFNNWLRDGAPIVNGVAVATGTSGAVRAKYLTGNTVTTASSGNHPLYGVVEFADTVESSRNSGKWKVPGYSRTVSDIVCSSGNFFFTSASFNGTSADLGRRIYISGAGSAGAGLLTSILSLSSPTNPVITDAIGTSLNPATGIVYEPMTIDGIHPDAVAHDLLKSAIPSGHFL